MKASKKQVRSVFVRLLERLIDDAVCYGEMDWKEIAKILHEAELAILTRPPE